MNKKNVSKSKLIIGADEAGYGPNLGPLVVATSAWRVPENFTEELFLTQFGPHFGTKPFSSKNRLVPLADSKQLYSPKTGLGALETGLLAFLSRLGPLPEHFQDFINRFSSTVESEMPWYKELNRLTVPCAKSSELRSGTTPKNSVTTETIEQASETVRQVLTSLDIELLQTRFYLLSEKKFNDEVQRYGSKGQLLSQATLSLVAETLRTASVDSGSVEIFCDRQGGRKNYIPVLMEAMPEYWFQELEQTPGRCSYRSSDNAITIHFSIGGDRFPPTALASMVAKYARERSMEAFNSYWQNLLPQILPTAGYPVDAKRFREEIEDRARELDLDPHSWWRNK